MRWDSLFMGIGVIQVLLVAGLMCIILLPLRSRRYKRQGLPRMTVLAHATADSLLVASLLGICMFTLLPFAFQVPPRLHANLIPFLDLLNHGSPQFMVGNIILFVPFGFLAALRFGQYTVWHILLVGIALSTVIEITQLFIPGRGTNIDDMLLNGLGTVLGAVGGRWVREYVQRRGWVNFGPASTMDSTVIAGGKRR